MSAHPGIQDRSACPSRERLLALSSGRLRGVHQDEVERHLAGCTSCLAVLQAVDDRSDPLIADLRGPVESEDATEDTLVEPTRPEGLGPRSGGSEADRSDEESVPERLGDYRRLERLGRGGMGTVYRAIHTRLGKVVALKVLRPERLGDRRAVDRFRQEIEATGPLEHPNLVRAHDAREEAGVPFLVMEYIAGLDLARLLERRGRLRVADACELARQAALGLDYAHREGRLVHRDVKPSNLMLTPEGCVKVLDLGVARLGNGPADVPERVGTADYMAPELWLMSHGADPRSDVYGLGCTLYELLAGSAPFARSEWPTRGQKMLAHALVPPPPIRELRPEVPEALAAVLDRLLAKCPADRYATPADVARALEPEVVPILVEK